MNSVLQQSTKALVPESGNRALQDFDAGKTAVKVHAAEAAERAARRAKNADALRRAISEKLETQREFAGQYKAIFNPGRPHNSDSSVRISSADYAAQYGFNERSVRRWAEKLLDEASFEAELEKQLAKVIKLVEMFQAASYSSESNEWYTPPQYLEAVHEALGGIDLDPASCPKANEVVKAATIFTQSDNGLNRHWQGRVFLNPPYGTVEGNSLAGLFCQKAIEEYQAGRAEEVIILVNSVHSQQWQRALYDHAICLVDHRIKFVSGDGEENENPTFQNIFVYLGKDRRKFAEVFSRFGYVMERIKHEP